MSYPSKFILVVSLVFIFIVIVLIIAALSLQKSNNLVTLYGTVTSAKNGSPLANYNISAGFLSTQTDYEGRFVLVDIPADSVLKISSGDLYEEMEMALNARTNINVVIDPSLFSVFRNVENAERNRQYSKIYDYLSPELQGKMSREDYINNKNKWRDKITNDADYDEFKIVFLRDSIIKREDGIKMTAVYTWLKSGESKFTKAISVNFKLINNTWYVDDSLTW